MDHRGSRLPEPDLEALERENKRLRGLLQYAIVLVDGARRGALDEELAQDWDQALEALNHPANRGGPN